MTTTAFGIYRFGEFRLDPAARELWQGDELVELPRLTFDGLTFLVENRDHAVSRDELINAVWEKPFVEEIQVTHLVMRVRRALGDDSHEPQFIRTVSGFGYRWIAETEELPAEAPTDPTTSSGAAPEGHRAAERCGPPDTETRPVLGADAGAAPESPAAAATPPIPWFRRWKLLVPLALVAVLTVVTLTHAYIQRNHTTAPLPREPGEAVAVLPLDVRAPKDADASWVRLGTMDLIAERLRDSGLPVSPSDSVVSALYATTEQPEAERLTALRHTLGAGFLIQGIATQATDGWTIELIATTANGDRRRVESEEAGVVAATRQAANLMLAALGETAPVASGDDDELSELLQRARAASLALELDTARSILTQAPGSMRNAPELRHELAWVEYRAGRIDEAEAIVTDLLEDPAVAVQPRLHAKALILRGTVAGSRQEDWVGGEPYFDAAVATLDEEPWAPELATALTVRGAVHVSRHDFDAAARDLGRARALFEVGGDRLGLARIYNFLGNLELVRKRPVDALPRFQAAIEIAEPFGHIESLRANSYALLTTQAQLLRWSDALAASERLSALQDRIKNPVGRHEIRVAQATVLIGLGRHREAEAILADLRQSEVDSTPFAARRSEQARAELAWQQGRPEQALRAAARMLEWWSASRSPTDELPTDTVLLHQRASIAAGQATPAAHTLFEAVGAVEGWEAEAAGDDPAYLVARAEWAVHQRDHDEAERLFRQAAAQAESWAVPRTLVLVADAYARWLLTRNRAPEALALAGRVADWAEQDYDSALLQVAVFHAGGQQDAWATALRRAENLAGEREIPSHLLVPGSRSALDSR